MASWFCGSYDEQRAGPASSFTRVQRLETRDDVGQLLVDRVLPQSVEAVMQRYAERDVKVLKSPACGAATWRSDQPETVLCQRNEGLRYWHHRP